MKDNRFLWSLILFFFTLFISLAPDIFASEENPLALALPSSRSGQAFAGEENPLAPALPSSRSGQAFAGATSPLQNKNEKIGQIEIRGVIDPGMAAYVERAILKAQEEEIDALLIVVDSPGGLVDSAERISKAILGTPIYSLAFVERQAISAAALIAISCNNITMTSSAIMGDAQPVDICGGSVCSEKVNSAVRGMFRAAAESRGRDKELAEAMVDASYDLPQAPLGKLLVFTAQEALEANFCDEIAEDSSQALKWAGKSGELRVFSISWSEKLARLITHPYFSVVLLWLGFSGIIIEILTVSGIGVMLSAFSFITFFFGSHIAGLAEWQTTIAFLGGLILLGAEIWATPGFGLLGVLGGILMLTSLLLSFSTIEQAVNTIAFALGLTVLFGYFLYKKLPRTRAWKKFILEEEMSKDQGFTVPMPEIGLQVGDSGITISPLRPVGRGVFSGIKYEIISEEGFIDADEKIKAVEIVGSRIMVRRTKA